MIDDFDAPNTKPGLCPECGQQADIWNVHDSTWECRYCNWKGRVTKQLETHRDAQQGRAQ